MKILSIGNSYSNDAHRYLYELGIENGKEITTGNLYIAACSLKMHYLNMINDDRKYTYFFNGKSTNLLVSIREALCCDDWDYITLQQASRFSFIEDSYYPYIEKLIEYIKIYSPKSKIVLHMTWAYPDNRPSLAAKGFETTTQMHSAIKETYEKVAKALNITECIPSGDYMHAAYLKRPNEIYRDGIHASIGLGRYLLANVWYKFLFEEIPEKHISRFDESVDSEQLDFINTLITKE